jgi:hypothetical protein
MSASSAPTATSGSFRTRIPDIPAPDTREGRALAVPVMLGATFVLLLVSVNTPLVNWAWAWIPLVLVLAAVLSLTLSSRLLTDRSSVALVELELGRTVSVHSASGQLPDAGSPLGGVLQEYVRTSDTMRRHWRTDVYAAGAAMWGGVLALLAALFWGLSFSTGVVWVGYLAIVVELPVMLFLIFSVTVIATGVGQAKAAPGFELLTPVRWRGYHRRPQAIDDAIAGLPWLAEFARTLEEDVSEAKGSTAPWSEATPTAS